MACKMVAEREKKKRKKKENNNLRLMTFFQNGVLAFSYTTWRIWAQRTDV